MDDSMPQNLVMLMLVQLYLTQQQGFPRFFVILLFVSLVIYPIPSLFGIFPSFKLKKKLNFGAKIPEGLSYAVNAAISVKSSYDNMKVIEDKYFNFFIWKIVTNYVYQRLAKKFGLPFLGQPIHKIRKCKKCILNSQISAVKTNIWILLTQGLFCQML